MLRNHDTFIRKVYRRLCLLPLQHDGALGYSGRRGVHWQRRVFRLQQPQVCPFTGITYRDWSPVSYTHLICGRRMETDFSPADGGHYRQAFRRRYIIQNKENKIDVLFETLKGKCHLAGIKIRKL